MRVRYKATAWLLIAMMPSVGCQMLRVSYTEHPVPSGRLVLTAVKSLNDSNPIYVAGILFRIFRLDDPDNGDLLYTLVSDAENPLVLDGLAPDTYKIEISGEGFEPHEEHLMLTEDRSAKLEFAVDTARANKTAGFIASAAIAVPVLVGVIWLALESDDDDDDDEDH